MSPRLFLVLSFVALAVACLGAVAAAVWVIVDRLSDYDQVADLVNIVLAYGGGVAFLLVAATAVLWAYLDHALARPLNALVRGIQTVLHANPDHRIEVEDDHRLGDLPEAVKDLVGRVAAARRTVNDAIAEATRRSEAQRQRLEVILQDLHEGVVICNMNHKILLYNNRALELLHVGGVLGLDRSLFEFTNRQPFVYALTRLTNRLAEGRHGEHPEGVSAPFVGASADGHYTLEGRMSLILDDEETPTGYVISFEDRTEELGALGIRDRLLREATEGLRQPVANIRAAAEILRAYPEMEKDEQRAFEDVVFNESNAMSERLEALAGQYREVITGLWPMTDIYSANLFNSVVRRLRDETDLDAVMIGLPQWLHGDSYTLVELLDRIIHRASETAGPRSFDLEAVAGERHVYLDVIWEGDPLGSQDLAVWLRQTADEAMGGLTLRDILDHHKTDIWCLPLRAGRAQLRLPLPPAKRVKGSASTSRRAARPEFYDFDLLQQSAHHSQEVGGRLLKKINYVVFDTETTGLAPSAGDEIISIAGVRLVNGRILTGESFDRLVNPRRLIPKASIKFHGITDEMVRDKPPIQLVLRQFREFVGDAVLVAHNAAFDLKFLRLREAECNMVFDMPVLDTLLLSVFLHDYTSKHSLDSVAERLGIEVQGRHTAFGDALATAGVFLRMVELLEARGINTLDKAIEASNTIVEVRAQQAQF